jgi:hypothetical protein
VADVDRAGKGLPLPVVLVAKTPSSQFEAALRQVGAPIVVDGGVIWKECNISQTPLAIKIDGQGRVLAKGVTHDVNEIAAAA